MIGNGSVSLRLDYQGTSELYTPAPALGPIPIFTWTGCYLGGHADGGFGQKAASDPTS